MQYHVLLVAMKGPNIGSKSAVTMSPNRADKLVAVWTKFAHTLKSIKYDTYSHHQIHKNHQIHQNNQIHQYH